MRIALYQPDQAGNVGTILRLAACLGVPVDIIHLKIADQKYWGRMAEVTKLIEDARRRGEAGTLTFPSALDNSRASAPASVRSAVLPYCPRANSGTPEACVRAASSSCGCVITWPGRRTPPRLAAMIAAVAIAHDLPLYPCNPGDFVGIDELEHVAVPVPPADPR